jgi:hypothetical protein
VRVSQSPASCPVRVGSCTWLALDVGLERPHVIVDDAEQ